MSSSTVVSPQPFPPSRRPANPRHSQQQAAYTHRKQTCLANGKRPSTPHHIRAPQPRVLRPSGRAKDNSSDSERSVPGDDAKKQDNEPPAAAGQKTSRAPSEHPRETTTRGKEESVRVSAGHTTYRQGRSSHGGSVLTPPCSTPH